MSSADSQEDDDPSFMALSTRLRHNIDDVFDSVVLQWRWSTGNVVADESEYEPGGFIIEDVNSKPAGPQSYIPLSEIPRALKLLGLSSDDDVMGVFKNAATGWGTQDICADGVSRKDWRAVCAALLEGEGVDGSEGEKNPDEEDGIGDDSGPDSDVYEMEEVSDDAEEGSSDEYEELGQRARRTKRAKTDNITRRTPTGPTAGAARQLTESEKAECRRDFGRFFPHVSDDELDQQRITVKDVDRVANVLKESLKTDQILEMLGAFSTSPDRSMNLADFEHMMILTKLI